MLLSGKAALCCAMATMCVALVPPIDMCDRCVRQFVENGGCKAWEDSEGKDFTPYGFFDRSCENFFRALGDNEGHDCGHRARDACGFPTNFGHHDADHHHGHGGGDGDGVWCEKDGYVCRDGTVLSRDPNDDCQFPDCAVIDIDFAYANHSKKDLEEFVQTGHNLDQFREWVLQTAFHHWLDRCQNGYANYKYDFEVNSCADKGCQEGENTCCRDNMPTSLGNNEDCQRYLRDVAVDDPTSGEEHNEECCPVCADTENPHYPFRCERDTFVGPTVCGGVSETRPHGAAEFPLPLDWDCSTGPDHRVEFGEEECAHVCHQDCDGSGHCVENCHDDCHVNPLPVETCRAVINDINSAMDSGSHLDFLSESNDFSAIGNAGFFGMLRATVTGHAEVEVSGECVWMPESKNYGTLEMNLQKGGQLVLFNPYNDASASLAQPLTVVGGMEVIVVKGHNSAHIQFMDNGHVSVWGLVNDGVTEFLSAQRVSVADVTNTGDITVHARSTNLLRVNNQGGVHVEGGVHVLNDIVNSGDVVMSNADAVLYNIINSGTVRVTGGGVLKAKHVINDGTVTIESGSNIDLHIGTMSGTGSLSIADGVTGTVRAPASIELDLPPSITRVFDHWTVPEA